MAARVGLLAWDVSPAPSFLARFTRRIPYGEAHGGP